VKGTGFLFYRPVWVGYSCPNLFVFEEGESWVGVRSSHPFPPRRRLVGNIRERGFLPIFRGEVPIAGAGFVIVAAGAVSNGGVAPIIHAHLQKGSARDSDAGLYGAAFEMACGECGAGGRAPEMPDAVGVLADSENYRFAIFRIRQREGIVDVGGEPGMT